MRLLVEALGCGHSPIIVDEPELSMHVDWQRDLLGAMTTVNPYAQVIVATHSPEIMAEIPETQIIML